MKLVRGIVREDKLVEVVNALERAGASGMTVTNVHGRGSNRRVTVFRGTAYPALDPMCAIEVIAADEAADDIARVMVNHAHTGRTGDGHVLVMPVNECYAIRTRWLDVA